MVGLRCLCVWFGLLCLRFCIVRLVPVLMFLCVSGWFVCLAGFSGLVLCALVCADLVMFVCVLDLCAG